MNVQETNEIRELTTAELELVAGGEKIDDYEFAAVLGFTFLAGVLAGGPCFLIGNVGVLKAL